MVSDKERRIALFIDFENLVTNTGISPSTFDLQPAMDRLLERGKVVFRRAYCDWSRFREDAAVARLRGGVDRRPTFDPCRQERRGHAVGHRRARAVLRTRAHRHICDRLRRQRLLPAGVQAAREQPDADRAGREGSDLAVVREGLRRIRLPQAANDDEGSCSPRVAAKDIRGTCRARDSADRARGRRRPARARNRSVEPVVDQGDHRPQGARLRRAGGRILHLQQVAAGDGTAGPAQAPAAERAPMVRTAAGCRGARERNGPG